MAAEKSNIVFDALNSFELGINSGVSPYRLPKNQLAFAVNATMRGDYVTNRPAYFNRQLIFSSDDVKAAFEGGLYQGGCYYQPDAGSQQIIVLISGRVYRITPLLTTATVDDITIPGDPDSATQPQAWLWQAEKWVIIQNGLDDPIFYDGISCRRSETTVTLRGQLANNFTVPPIGGEVAVTLTAPYSGLLNSTLNLNELDANGNLIKTANYLVTEVNGNQSLYHLVITNLSDSLASEPASSQLIIQPANLGIVSSSSSCVETNFTSQKSTILISAPAPSYVAVNATINLSGSGDWKINSISSDRLTLTISRGGGLVACPSHGMVVTLKNYNAPNVPIGQLKTSLTVPPAGSNATANLVNAYTGQIGQVLFINNGQYKVVSFSTVPPTPNASVTIKNLNDTAAIDPTTGMPIDVLAGSQFFNLPELPAGRMGTYGMGRVWECLLDGISFIAGDIVGGSSGSPAYSFRDSVLKVTENTYLAGGGAFRVPGAAQQITAMAFSAILDTSLGQGNLQVFTNENAFSVNTPVDRLQWQNVTNPILTESLIGSGSSGQNCVVRVNGDLIFRSPNPNGIRSMLLARLDFNRWGNTPNSREMTRVINSENIAGLPFCSAIQFDNRLLMTASHVQTAQGVFGQGIMALNFDPNSSLAGKESSIYDGFWTGLNIFQLFTGQFSGVQRAFSLCLNTALTPNKIELWEILKTGEGDFDNGSIPIQWSFETPILFNNIKGKGEFDLVALRDGEIYVSDLISKCVFNVEWRPEFSECFFPWFSWSCCADKASNVPQYRSRMGFGSPSASACETASQTPAMLGRWHQLRITVTGHCKVMATKLKASIEPQSEVAKPIC